MKPILIILLLIIICSWSTKFFPIAVIKTEPISVEQKYTKTVLLLPLDSRPPCTNFPVELGDISNMRILLPPKEILDHYKQAGDTAALRQWCHENASKADAAILSIDMLLHGGLLASRHGSALTGDIEETLQLLTQLRQENPSLPLYAFHILPRLWPADNEENNKYQKEILKYTKLIDQIYTFENPLDIEKLEKIIAKVPPEVINNYNRVFEENLQLNKQLVHFAQTGVLTKLIIGQDDGESFGIPNMAKRRLMHYISTQGIDESKVFVTKGADEIAMTLLATIANETYKIKPKINVQYGDDGIPSIVMPYMANSIGTSVKEKIAIINGTITEKPDEADFILFVYVGSDRNVGHQYVVNQKIQSLVDQNYRVALVDLSEHFAPDETILPVLMQNSAAINRLIAYSGWNTASNSIGTAISQASLFTVTDKITTTDIEKLTLYKNNLTFLTDRFLEDYFYLKHSIDTINRSLKSEGTDIYDLNDRYLWANTILKADMFNKSTILKNSFSYQRSIPIQLEKHSTTLKITDLIINISYPWERTFEINIDSIIKLEKSLT